MAGKQSIDEFYELRVTDELKASYGELGPFHIFRKDDTGPDKAPIKYSRRDFYKIALVHGHHLYHYADRTIEVTGGTLVFSNPETPYTFEPIAEEPGGYFCIFKESFFSEYLRNGLRELQMYQIGGKHTFPLTKEYDEKISAIFEKMHEEINSTYRFKYDLLRSYVTEVMHVALKLQPADNLYTHTDANARITAVFMELLERQFPIEDRSQQFIMKRATDFAKQLSVHVNHLNRAVKLTTGKTTTAIIYERLTNEARALLKHTDWNVAEIGYSLGFDDPTHFNHFFKKQTNTRPLDYRN